MIAFENELIIPGPLQEIQECLLIGKPLPAHDDFAVNLAQKMDEAHYLLFIKEKLLIHELGYRMESAAPAVGQVVWSQTDHKRFIDRTILWDLTPVSAGVKVRYRFEAHIMGNETGEMITRRLLTDISRTHLDRLLREFKDQMAWVVEESKKPPAEFLNSAL